MKVLFYGHSGWIGNMMCKLFDERKVEYVKAKSRCDDIKNVTSEIKSESPSHVICTIGRTRGEISGKKYTTIDYLEQKGKIYDNVRDNMFAPLVLARICELNNIHLTYLGTGCIFNFDNSHPYGNDTTGFTEEDTPNFIGSSYSIVKGFTDQLMHLYDKNVLNLRIRMPITDKLDPPNFITKILNYEYICSQTNSMTVLDELLPFVIDMMEKKQIGTINLTNPGLITHNEILEMYRDIIDNEFKWKNFTLDEQNGILDAQRCNCYISADKLNRLYPEVKNIKESVKDTLKRMKRNINK